MTVQQGTSAGAESNGSGAPAGEAATQAMLGVLNLPGTAAPVVAPVVTPAGAAATPPAVAPVVAPVDTSEPAWLPQRLGQAKSAAVKEMLQEFGYKSKEELDAALRAGKAARDAALSESERQANRLKELEPLEGQVKQYKELAEGFINTAFNALPPQVQAAIDSVAGGDPFKRKAQLDVLQAAGFLSAAGSANLAAATNVTSTTPTPTTPVAPVVPLASAGAVQPPPTQRPAGTQTLYEKYEAIPDPQQKRIFYSLNGRGIEESRPAS